MDAPLTEIPGICDEFCRRFDDYQQLAGEQGKHDLVDTLENAMNELSDLSNKVRKGHTLSDPERNGLRMTIKFTEKLVAGELIFPEK